MKKIVTLDEVAKKFKRKYKSLYIYIGNTADYLTIVTTKDKEERFSFEEIKRKFGATNIQLGLLLFYDERSDKETEEDCIILFYG